MGNEALFRTRNLRQEIYTSSRRNKFCEDPTKESEKLHQKEKNKLKEYCHNRVKVTLLQINDLGTFQSFSL